MGGHSGLDGAREHDASPNEGDDLKTSTDPRPDDSRPNEVSTQRWIEDRVRQRLLAGPLPKERIGRFVVLESIGRGAMGQVHAAYDERLDRRVAIKVLLDEDLADREDRARFVREAQAMARLSHPNVVTVHEVGDSDGSIYLAMEHIRGQILSVWLRTGPDWRQVLDAFVQAGQGLAAAHAEGLVHRDFKPQNAMRTEQGQVKVLDFGLARAATDVLLQSHDHEELTSTGSYSMLTSELTQAGTLMGTPAYMAPEQFDGDVVDASSDQYSFCVALWEGLVGTRPFAAATVDEILALKRQGAPPWPAHAPAVPPKIVDALRRGLAVDPRERWPSMDALLSALAPDTRHSGRRWLGLAVVGGLGLAGAVFASGSGDHPQQCQGARGQLEGIWDDARRHEVAGALLGIDRAFAQEVSDTTTRQLDDYTNDWVAMHTDACEATAVRKDQSPQMLDLRMACLRRAADGLEATVTTLAHADQTVVSRAHELVTGLPPLSHCADTSALEAEVEPLLPEQAEAVQQGRRQLSRAKSLRLAGLYEAAHTAVTEASQTLGEVSYAPTRVELALERGEVLDALGRYDAAVSTYEEALTLALQSGQRAPAALAARRLLVAVGVNQRQAKAALLLRPLVLGVSLGDPMDEAEARNGLGALLRSEGRNEESEREHREALNLLTSVVDPEHPAVVETRNLLAK
ncbi:MAG: serine/threonine-protein kinase, partial [Nannocystaceae bacterium]